MIPGWKDELQGEYLAFLRGRGRMSPFELAAHLAVSERSAVYWLTDLAREGKLRIIAVELVEENPSPCVSPSASACQRTFCPVEATEDLSPSDSTLRSRPGGH